MKMKFKYVLLISALLVSGIGAYFSVWGLSQLFAGASTAVIIMAGILEVGKVVTTTALHRYWDKLAKTLKIYLTISVSVLMLITSAGIYGFLSNAYQKTANKLEIHDGELGVLDGKKGLFEKNIIDNEKIVVTKNKRIDQLTNLRLTQENRLDSAKTNRGKDKVRSDIDLATTEIQSLSKDIDGLNAKNAILSDSVSKYNVKSLELKSSSEVAGEVGPLKYIAELTGTPMGKVVNYLILLLIFVFDPLAIALILMTNKVFELDNDKKSLQSKIDVILETEEPQPKQIIKTPVEDQIEPPIETSTEELSTEEVGPWDYKIDDTRKKIESVDDIPEPIKETKLVSDAKIEVPVIPTGKIKVEDIKEIKEGNRGYSVPVPNPKGNNTIQRIGSNKIVKNGDNDTVFFKRK